MRLAGDLGLPARGYQGNWIPHQLRRAVEDGVFFVGDSAGHCLPLTAEGIRTALYFGLACGRELRAVLDGSRTREQALARYARLLGRPRAQIPLAAGGPAGDGPDHPEPRRRRRREGLREPAPEPLGVLALPGDRAPVVRRPPAPPPGPRARARAAVPPPRWPARPGWRSRARARRPAAAASGSRSRAGRPRPSGDPPPASGARPSTAAGRRTIACSPAATPVTRAPGQVAGDRGHERVPPGAIAAAGLAQVAVVVAGFDQVGEGELLERRRAGVGQALALRRRRPPAARAAPASPAAEPGPASC